LQYKISTSIYINNRSYNLKHSRYNPKYSVNAEILYQKSEEIMLK